MTIPSEFPANADPGSRAGHEHVRMPWWRRPALNPAVLRRPSLLLNVALGLLALLGVVLAYRTVTVADTATATNTGGGRTVPVTQGPVSASVSASGAVQSASTAS